MKKKRGAEKHTPKRRDDGNNKRTIPRDKHHSAHTPCCDLIEGVVAEIFPQVAALADVKDGNETSEAAAVAPTGEKEQPLLGFMIQRHLIEMHEKNGRGVNNGNGSSEAATKSSKKKKKKKKKSSSKIESSGNGEGSAPEEAANSSIVEEAGCDSAATKCSTVNDQANESTSNGRPAQSASLPPPDAAANTSPSNLDCFLDSIIDQHPSQSTDKTRINRNLESFAAYLSRKYETCVHHRNNPQKNGKKKDTPSTKTTSEMDLIDILPTISLDDLKLHSSSIDCRLCQTSVNSQLKQLYLGLHQTNNVLPWGTHAVEPSKKDAVFILDDQSVNIHKPSPLTIAGFDDERAFDYVCMDDDLDLEAGTTAPPVGASCSSSSFRLEFHPVSVSGEDEARFLQIKASTGESEDFPLSVDGIINLIKSVILPCGVEMGPSEADNHQLSDVDFESIIVASRERCDNFLKEVTKIHSMKDQMQNDLMVGKESNGNRSAFDSATASKLMSCNNMCEFGLKTIGSFLIDITKITCFVGWRTNDYGPGLMKVMVDCWSMFNVTLDKLIEPTMKYKGSVLQLCKRPGVVPIMATTKMMRDSFIDYLSVKVVMIEKLISYLDENLINPMHKSYYRARARQAPSPLARLCVLDAFMSHCYKAQNAKVPDIFPNADDECEFAKLLEVRVRLSQNVLQGANKKNIDEKEGKMLSEMKTLYASIVQTVILKKNDYQSAPEFIKDYHDRVAMEREKADRQLQSEPEEYSPELIGALMNTSQLLTMEWIYVLCMRQSYCPVEFAIPSRLDSWMESIEGNNISLAKPIKEDPTRCDGLGAKRRLSGAFSVLLYRWLEARCSEWHAELTQNELLTSVEFDLPTVNEGVAKTSKKKKKRKGSDKASTAPKEDATEPKTVQPDSNSSKTEEVQAGATAIASEKQIKESELQPSSPNAVDGDINSTAEKASASAVNIKSIQSATELPLPIADCNAQCQSHGATGAPQQKDQPEGKKKKKIKVAPNKNIQDTNRNSEKVPSSLNVDKGNPNVHTPKYNHAIENEFVEVKRSSAKKPNGSTSTNGSNNKKPQLVQTNNESSSQKGRERTTAVAKESNPPIVAKPSAQVGRSKPAKALAESSSKKPLVDKQSETRVVSTASKKPSSTTKAEPSQDAKQSNSKPAIKQSVNHSPEVTAQSNDASTANQKTEVNSKPKASNAKPANKPAGKQPHDIDVAASASAQKADVNTKLNPETTEAGIVNTEPHIGVIDYNGQFVSAEDFLVARMNVLLAEIEEIKSRYTLWY